MIVRELRDCGVLATDTPDTCISKTSSGVVEEATAVQYPFIGNCYSHSCRTFNTAITNCTLQ